MAMSLQQQAAVSLGLRAGPIWKPALSFHRVSLPFKSIKQSVLVATRTHQKCPFFKNHKEAIFFTAQTHKNPFSVKSILEDAVDGYGSGYNLFNDKTEKAAKEIISMMSKQQIGCASALNQLENTSGKLIPRRLLHCLIFNLDYKQRFQDALEVYEWMNSRGKRYKFMTPAETNWHLYLIAKVHGISSAEEYFVKLPDKLKKKELYNVILVRYAVSRRVIRAESFFEEMKNRGYACYAVPFNVMMLLYNEIERYDDVMLMISKMIEENISLDQMSYEIWLLFSETQECMDKLLEHMKRETNSPFFLSILQDLFHLYLEDLKQIEKAEECVKLLETRYMNESLPQLVERLSTLELIQMYALLGKTREVHQLWEADVGLHDYYYDRDHHDIISDLTSLNDAEGAEKIYDDWVSHGPADLLISKANYCLGALVGLTDQELSGKVVEPFFNKMIKSGIIPNLKTWEILARYNVKMKRISEALSCLRKCFEGNYETIEGGRYRFIQGRKCKWFRYISRDIIEICEEEGDMASKDILFNLLRGLGCDVNEYK